MTTAQVLNTEYISDTHEILKYFITGGKIKASDFIRMTGFGTFRNKEGEIVIPDTFDQWMIKSGGKNKIQNKIFYSRYLKTFVQRGAIEYKKVKWCLSENGHPLDTLYEVIDFPHEFDCMDLNNLVIDTLLTYGSITEMRKAFDTPPESEYDDFYQQAPPESWDIIENNEVIGHADTQAQAIKKAIQLTYHSKFREFTLTFTDQPDEKKVNELKLSGWQMYSSGKTFTAPRTKRIISFIAENQREYQLT
jgi:hypothetical protein